MAITRSRNAAEVILDALRTFFHHKRDQLHLSLERHKVYRNTIHELSALTDRELADVGIPRSHIRRLARETAYSA
ncbi:MAG: DUF1127 domain-containing protein [Rhodobacteraceae bacterium]|nr:DUF1127 domain-containing protein [Paracoccaceae bacterium]MCW9044468.1 DUF1127 domain-containing protein [Pseudopelagicola sp.]